MRQLSTSNIILITLYLLGFFAVLFLVNAFFGEITTHLGKVKRKYVIQNSQGQPFYRVSIANDSSLMEIQTQPNDYKQIEVGDYVTYTIRRGLFNKQVIERYNAKLK
jgi:hypothetical protein